MIAPPAPPTARGSRPVETWKHDDEAGLFQQRSTSDRSWGCCTPARRTAWDRRSPSWRGRPRGSRGPWPRRSRPSRRPVAGARSARRAACVGPGPACAARRSRATQRFHCRHMAMAKTGSGVAQHSSPRLGNISSASTPSAALSARRCSTVRPLVLRSTSSSSSGANAAPADRGPDCTRLGVGRGPTHALRPVALGDQPLRPVRPHLHMRQALAEFGLDVRSDSQAGSTAWVSAENMKYLAGVPRARRSRPACRTRRLAPPEIVGRPFGIAPHLLQDIAHPRASWVLPPWRARPGTATIRLACRACPASPRRPCRSRRANPPGRSARP